MNDMSKVEPVQIHPLDRCTAKELEEAVGILKAANKLSELAFYSSGFADEPDKNVVLNFKAGTSF